MIVYCDVKTRKYGKAPGFSGRGIDSWVGVTRPPEARAPNRTWKIGEILVYKKA